ncbi:MAG: hypothetical protein WCR39_04805 [Bacteroidales bacterium]
MKKAALILGVALLISWAGRAQTVAPKSILPSPCLDVSAGWVFKSSNQALRGTISYNNFLFNRLGVFTSVEVGFGSSLSTHIVGITGSITDFLYLFAGADVFTNSGLIKKGIGARKVIGFGVYPWKWAVMKVGFSLSVGPYAEIGVRIPLEVTSN